MSRRALARAIRDLARQRSRQTDRAEWLRIHQQIEALTLLWAQG